MEAAGFQAQASLLILELTLSRLLAAGDKSAMGLQSTWLIEETI